MYQPLADKVRPKTFKEMIGNQKLINTLDQLLKSDNLVSLILYGPTGVGKTTIADIIASKYPLNHFRFNASTDNKATLKQIVDTVKLYHSVILIIDEIHRMNRDIQDYLLPYVEKGNIVMIGLTTENPYISVNPAVRSRVSIFKVTRPKTEEIELFLKRIDFSDYEKELSIKDEVFKKIAFAANGEVRTAINMLELLVLAAEQKDVIDFSFMEKHLPESQISAFKTGDDYYDILSAFHKSVRGSDVNAALHYLARLVVAGDLKSLVRRIRAIVYEDIGLANPMMGVKVEAACSVAESVGFPEARNALGAIVIEMCISPKSNSVHLAIDKAIADVETGKTFQVPSHLINNPTYDDKEDYKYAHDYENHIVKQDYLPKELQGVVYYEPQTHTKLEKAYSEEYLKNEKIIK
ncbi:MAG: replication-associated recombination protein A [Candidatus Izemoplasmatales bacterium]|nr:replication-associated recombination protein A [Candidatus Izemoplasmatales bacterium]